MKKQTKNEAMFTIHGDLAKELAGMEASNWCVHISRNQVRKVTATFRVKQPMISVGRIG